MKKDKINLESVMLGSDPELFLYNESLERFETAIGLIGGTKAKPIPISDNGHMIQEDGVSVEFNIPPCKTADEYVHHINFVKEYIKTTIAEPRGFILAKAASAEFTEEQLACKQAQEIGCTPDIDAWKLELNSPKGYTSNLRASGKIGCHLN